MALKLWVIDEGWAGMSVAIAETKEEAAKAINDAHPYSCDSFYNQLLEELESREIVAGLVEINTGDS